VRVRLCARVFVCACVCVRACVCVCFLQVALSFIQIFFVGNFPIQLVLIAILLLIAAALQESYAPFDHKLLNKAERASLLASAAVYVASLGTSHPFFSV